MQVRQIEVGWTYARTNEKQTKRSYAVRDRRVFYGKTSFQGKRVWTHDSRIAFGALMQRVWVVCAKIDSRFGRGLA
jgi:hypothetical protein